MYSIFCSCCKTSARILSMILRRPSSSACESRMYNWANWGGWSLVIILLPAGSCTYLTCFPRLYRIQQDRTRNLRTHIPISTKPRLTCRMSIVVLSPGLERNVLQVPSQPEHLDGAWNVLTGHETSRPDLRPCSLWSEQRQEKREGEKSRFGSLHVRNVSRSHLNQNVLTGHETSRPDGLIVWNYLRRPQIMTHISDPDFGGIKLTHQEKFMALEGNFAGLRGIRWVILEVREWHWESANMPNERMGIMPEWLFGELPKNSYMRISLEIHSRTRILWILV